MDNFDRNEAERAVRLLDSWLHSGAVDKPRQILLDAMHTATKHMQRVDSVRTVPLYARTCAVLSYHITHPLAELFRDPVTIDAIKTGISALEKALGWRQT